MARGRQPKFPAYKDIYARAAKKEAKKAKKVLHPPEKERNAKATADRIRLDLVSEETLIKKFMSSTGSAQKVFEAELNRRRNNQSKNQAQSSHLESIKDRPAQTDASSSLMATRAEPLGHTQDALGRYRPAYKKADKLVKPAPKKEPPKLKDGAFSIEVERIETTARRIKRDGTFRDRVLGTYGAACVICGYAVHVEAAHLDPKHQVSDDRTENGAPLCRNHHWELDHGHLTPDEVRRKRDAS